MAKNIYIFYDQERIKYEKYFFCILEKRMKNDNVKGTRTGIAREW